MMEYFELDKRKNFDERKYLSTELLDKLGLNKYRKLIEENDAIYCSGKYGYKLKNETYEKINSLQIDDYAENECENLDIDEYDITATPNDFNVMTLNSFIESGAVIIPGFQRNFVWDIGRSSKLIESLLLGLPVPNYFYMNKKEINF